MDDTLETDALEQVWRALSDPTRRGILDRLRSGPRTTGDLAGEFPNLTRFGVMKHLGVLEDAGLIVTRKQGRTRVNHLNAVPIRRIYDRWVSKYEDRWASSLLRLKHRAERPARKGTSMGTKLIDTPARIAVVETAIEIAAPRDKVYDAFVNDIGNWFYPDHEPGNKTAHFEPTLGGKFYIRDETGEKKGDENLMAIVTLVRPGRKLRLKGDFTLPEAIVANVTIAFEDAGSGTKISISHRMMGEFEDDLPAGFEEGWLDGLQKLKALVEK
ncbi:MAG: SRPBCC domain-containing protein [Phycisphaerales bacterium JB037]